MKTPQAGEAARDGAGWCRQTATLLVAVWLLASCAVQTTSATNGCAGNNECKDGRVCADRLCTYPEDLARRQAARHVGEGLLKALAAGEPRYFASLWLDAQDYAFAFDFPPSDNPAVAREQALTEEFAALLRSGRDWSRVSLTRFEPGASRPIPAGSEHAKQNLARLQGSRLYFKEPGVEGEQVLLISDLLLLRGRWRLFRLAPSAASLDGGGRR